MSWSILTRSDEIALEELVLAIAKQGRRAWVAAALAAARHAYPIAIAAGGDDAFEWGFAEDSPSLDGESEGMKLRRVEAWLAAPGPETIAAVAASIDPTRQVEIYSDDDMRPPDDGKADWMWFGCVGQLCAQATAFKDEGDPEHPLSHHWPASVCAARCVVAAAKTIGDVAAIAAVVSRTLAS